MARIRVPDELRDKVRNHVKESGEYDTISEFTKDALRRLLDQKEKDLDDEELEEIIDKKVREALS